MNFKPTFCAPFSRVKSPQPIKVPCFTNNNFSSQADEAAVEELQKIISFTPVESISISPYLLGGIEAPVLAPSPSPSVNFEVEREEIPSRSNNPLVLNTPFVDQDACGAELGLLSPSPPPSIAPVNIHKFESAAERKQKRLRSYSCPEAKNLLRA